jgi:hypothetical protein
MLRKAFVGLTTKSLRSIKFYQKDEAILFKFEGSWVFTQFYSNHPCQNQP